MKGGLYLANSTLYGTIQTHAGVNGDGAAFSVDPKTGGISTFSSFVSATTGASPNGDLIADSHGDLYGTTSSGGSNGDGTIFKFDPTTGMITTLASFGVTDTGIEPGSGLIADAAGNLFGTTSQGGGPGSGGTVFEYNVSTGKIEDLYDFQGRNNPTGGLVADSAGNLYGVASQQVYELSGTGFVVPEPTACGLFALAASIGIGALRRCKPQSLAKRGVV